MGSSPIVSTAFLRFVQSLIHPRRLAHLVVAFREVRCVAGCAGVEAGSEFEISVSFTLKDNNTVDFVEEGSQYKSVLHRCPAK